MPLHPTALRGRVGRIAAVCTTWLALVLASPISAAPGDQLFTDSFESGFGKWTTTDASRSGVNAMTYSSASRSLYLLGTTATTTTIATDTRAASVRVQAWIQRGSKTFSDKPAPQFDLTMEYRAASGTWIALESWRGAGQPGEIFRLDRSIDGSTLDAAFRLRIRLVQSNGNSNNGNKSSSNSGYWHVDDVVVSEQAPSTTVKFVIVHQSSAAQCQPETMQVLVQNLAGNLVPSYAGTITLDTQTSTGSWSLVRGNGQFQDATPGDGRATYAFSTSDGGDVSFALSYWTGPSIVNVDVYNATSRDDDSEGDLTFAPKNLNLTANAIPDPPPPTIDDPIGVKTAGESFPLHLTAFGGTSGGGSCGVIDSYDGDKSLRFWAERVDPTSAPLVPTVDQTAIATSEAAAARQTVRFTRGRAVVSVRYKDTGRLAIRVLDDGGTAPISGSTGSFVSRPANFRITSVTNSGNEPNPGAGTTSGALFARAGEAFRVTVDVEDAEGSRTPSYGREAVPEGIRLKSSALVAPIGGRNGTRGDGAIENATSFTVDTTPGRLVGTSFAFDEVGAIRMQASVADGDFLGAGPILGTESGTVGRFAPSHFEVVANVPRFATACPVGAFTWLGQPFQYAPGSEPDLVVTAVNRAGETTANYAGDWFRLKNATLARRTYQAGGAVVDASGLPATTADPSIDSNDDGTANLRFSTGRGLVLTRSAPRAPFDAELELSIDILDADATAYPTNPFRVGGTTAGAGIAFDTAKRFQFGRLRVDNAYGSELVSLPMRLRAQRFDGTAFADDDSDSCSTVPESALILSPSPAKLATLPEVAHVPLFSGDAGLVMSAPGAPGDVAVRINLGVTGANLPWLRSDWPEDGNLDGTLDDDPQARATFGIWEGRDAMIFLRELY